MFAFPITRFLCDDWAYVKWGLFDYDVFDGGYGYFWVFISKFIFEVMVLGIVYNLIHYSVKYVQSWREIAERNRKEEA